MSPYISINPYTEQLLKTYPGHSDDVLMQLLKTAHHAQQQWKQLSFHERALPVLRLGELIVSHASRLALMATREMGKPIQEAHAEVLKCKTACTFYAGNSESILATRHSESDTGKKVTLMYEPLGTVLGVFPWNFPYWQIIRSAIPVVMAGNSMLIKPAPNAPQTALALQHLFDLAGFPQGILQTILASNEQVSMLIRQPEIAACTLTGSESAGASVASQAAAHIKKSVLELGGSDPFIVLPDADISLAVETGIVARFQNNGQSCIASKRFFLHQDIAEEFVNGLSERMASLKLGNPEDPTVQIGPLARKDLLYRLKEQVDISVAAGATIRFQHSATLPTGYFYPPTILTNIPSNSPAYNEELFGPVVSVFTFSNTDEAIQMANDSAFGLGASVWSGNPEHAKQVALKLSCGQVFINALVKSNAHYPFGGVKRSGYGRELGEYGLREFCSVKTIWV